MRVTGETAESPRDVQNAGRDDASCRQPAPRASNIALAGVFLCVPTGLMALVGLLIAGQSLGVALLSALGLQVFVLCAVVLIGLMTGFAKPADEAARQDLAPSSSWR